MAACRFESNAGVYFSLEAGAVSAKYIAVAGAWLYQFEQTVCLSVDFVRFQKNQSSMIRGARTAMVRLLDEKVRLSGDSASRHGIAGLLMKLGRFK